MKLTWREATGSDLALLAEWNHQLIRDEGHRNRMTVEELAQRMEGWLAGAYRAVVFSEEEPVAYALFKADETFIYLRQFFVRRDRRRSGVGRAAWRILKDEVWPKDVRLTVDVLCENRGAVAFWRSVGYRDRCLTLEIMPAAGPKSASVAPSCSEPLGRRSNCSSRTLTYRKLTVRDVAEFRRVRLRALEDCPSGFGSSFEESRHLPLEAFQAMLDVPDTEGMVWGGFEGERLAGFGGLRRESRLKERHKAFIWGVYVDSDYRRKGVGRKLLVQLIEEAMTMPELLLVKLTVESSNMAAKALYESLGFRKFGCEPSALRVDGMLFDEDYLLLRIER